MYNVFSLYSDTRIIVHFIALCTFLFVYYYLIFTASVRIKIIINELSRIDLQLKPK